MSARAPSRRYDSVQQDWRAFLPEAKADFFTAHTRELENTYLAFSVSLNEALDLRNRHLGFQALETATIASDLCSRLAQRVGSVLHSLRQRGRHFGILPNFAPLDLTNFQTEYGQRAARSSGLVARILLSRHSQFLQKVFTLERIVETLDHEFHRVVEQLGPSERYTGHELWRTLQMCHFDLNTCFRETEVLLKSFLLVLPEAQLEGLDFTIRALCRARHVPPAVHVFRPRRMPPVAGK